MGKQQYYFSRIGLRGGRALVAHFQATFSGGVATVDSSVSDPGITLVKDAAGDYDVAGLPTGDQLIPLGLFLAPASDTPADVDTTKDVLPRSLSASAGTGKLLFFNGDDGDQADPGNGTRLYATFMVRGI